MKTITYAVDLDTGHVVSRVGDQVLFAVLDFAHMAFDNNWEMRFSFEKVNVFAIPNWYTYKWTKKIPNVVKNIHRKMWDMRPLV